MNVANKSWWFENLSMVVGCRKRIGSDDDRCEERLSSAVSNFLNDTDGRRGHGCHLYNHD